jgi:putative MATE family efflux protein
MPGAAGPRGALPDDLADLTAEAGGADRMRAETGAPAIAATPAARFLHGSLMRHVTVMSLTASVGLMAVFSVDVVSMVYVAWLGQAELAAAVGYAGAILFFTTSFGIGMSIAAGALVARALGAGDARLARRRAGHALVHGLWVGVLFALAVWLALGPLVRLLGAAGETERLTIRFLAIIVPSFPFLMVGMIGGAILRAHGDARRAMMATIWGALANALLDPLLIFGLGLGLSGAAIASAAARVVIGVTALLPILRVYGGFERPTLGGLAADLRPVFGIAVPAILTQVATPVGQAFVTRAMAAYGEAAVAGMAITARMTPVAFGVIFALSGAIGPIIGQNYGAGRMDRVRSAFRAGLAFAAAVVAAVSLALFLLRAPIAGLFRAQGTARELVYLFCGPLSLMFFFNGALFVANAACNNLGRPFQSTLVNWGRHTLGTVPFVMLFALWFGAAGVLVGQAVGGVAFAALAIWQAERAIAAAPLPRGRHTG